MMVYGRTPFQHITNHVIKLQCIMDPSHEIEFRDIKDKNLLDVMKVCLAICFDLQSYSLSMVLFSASKLIVGNCHNVNFVSPLYAGYIFEQKVRDGQGFRLFTDDW